MLILNLGCSNNKTEVGDGLPYFQFLPIDNDKFINATEVGKILIYKNQNNAELKFKVLKNKTEKQLESRVTFVVGSNKLYYYDEQRIQFGNIADTPQNYYSNSTFFISIRRVPIVLQGNISDISGLSKLATTIGLCPFDNTENAFLDYTESTISLTINTQLFTKVRKINLPINLYPNPNSRLKGLKSIYFDQNKGVIGFDDIQNNEWRLQN